MAAGEIIIPGRSARMRGNVAAGPLTCMRTVIGSTTSTVSTVPSSGATAEPSTVLARSMLIFTASASNGVPSWNVTPSRSLSSRAVSSSTHSHSVARPGTSEASGISMISGS